MTNLSHISIFQGLNEDDLQAISTVSTIRNHPKNTIVMYEGDPTNSLYLLLDGQVKVFVSDEEGKEFVLDTLAPGDYFGELSLLDEEKRSASVMTLEPCSFSVINRAEFMRLVEKHPSISTQMLTNLVRLIRQLNENVKNLALKDVYGRIRTLFLKLAVDSDGILTIPLRLTQQDIANRVGSSREMVARILKDLIKGGYVQTEKKQIKISKTLPESY